MRVLITGIDGFTGGYLKLKLAESGHVVTGLSANLMDFNSIEIEIEKMQPEAVVHLAGVSFAGHKEYKQYYDVNLIGTRNLLEALHCHSKNLKSVLVASSASVYGNSYQHPIKENDNLNPVNDYAISKLALEYVAKLFMDKLPIFIVRPFNYTGLGQSGSFLIPKIIEHFNRKRSIIELGNVMIQREFNDVRNVINTYSDLLINAPSGKIFNICTEKTFSIQEIVSRCEKITNHKMEIKVNRNFCRSNDANRLVGSGQYLRKFINPKNVFSLDDTLRWMLS
jgi:GDP-6-deoxy-D-talose 4-dehydrogenase